MQSISAIDISSAGMAAERRRMEVTANNIANANTTMTDRGEPFRRQMVVFSSADDASGATEGGWGVRVEGVEPDPTEFPGSLQSRSSPRGSTGHGPAAQRPIAQ